MLRNLLWMLIGLTCLTACSIFQNTPEQTQKAMCQELKHRIIFNGATSNAVEATQQRAESGGLAKSYREENCD